jgi:hypothetical protein
MNRCQHCGIPYDWKRSTSWSLKLTFCSMLCEQKQNGSTIENILATEKNNVIDMAAAWLMEHQFAPHIEEAFGSFKDSKGRVA